MNNVVGFICNEDDGSTRAFYSLPDLVQSLENMCNSKFNYIGTGYCLYSMLCTQDQINCISELLLRFSVKIVVDNFKETCISKCENYHYDSFYTDLSGREPCEIIYQLKDWMLL